MAIKRQELGQQLQSAQLTQRGGRTVNTAYQTSRVEDGADLGVNILNTVLNASGQALQLSGQKFKQKIEDDKVRQMNRALLDLQPTDDSTQAGYVAHGIVGVQNEVLKETKRLEQLAATFQGSDEEWQEELVQSRSRVQEGAFSKYPQLDSEESRNQFLGVITNSFLEQSPRLTTARISGKLEQERQARITTFQENLLQKMEEVPDSEVANVIGPLISENRKALQLSQVEAEAVLMQAAIDAANRGDKRLINFTKTYGGKVSLFDKEGKLQNAEKVADKVWAAENVGAIAMSKDSLNTSFLSGDITWPQMAAAAEELNTKTGNTAYTDDQLLSLKNQRQRAIASKVDLSLLMEQANSASLEGGRPVGITSQDDKQKQALVEEKQSEFELIEQSIIRQSPEIADDPEAMRQLRNRTNQMFSEWISSNQLVNEGWKEQFNTVLNYNLDNVDENTDIPSNLNDVLDLWHTLPAGSRVDHASPQAHAMLTNYEEFLAQGKSPIQALALSQKAVRSNKTFGTDQFKKIRSAAASAAKDLTSGSWLPFDSAPSWYRDIMTERLEAATITNMKAGYLSPEKAAKDAASAFERHHTTLKNGQLIFGDRTTVASQMQVNPEDIELTLDTYLEMNSEQLLDRAGGASLDELYYDVVPGRGIAYIRSGVNGMPVTPPIVLSELKVGRDEYLNSRKAARLERANRQQLARPGADLSSNNPTVLALTEQREADIERSRMESIDGWTGAARLDEARPTQAAMKPEQNKVFEAALMEAENSIKDGYNKELGVWTPHKSLEGGTDTIGYGHKLTAAEARRGYIELEGKRYKFTDGDSEITEQVALKLMRKGVADAERSLKKAWSSYDELPDKYQKVLINLQFNTGSATPSNWPKLKEAMLSGDDSKVRSEMITSYTGRTGNKKILEERARLIADALGL